MVARPLQLMAVALIADRRVDIDDAPAVIAGTNPRRERWISILRRAAIAVWAVVVVFRTWTTGFAFNRELLLIYICTGLIAASIGRRRILQVIRDWLPFALILVIYDLSRGAATLIGTPTLWQIQPKIDR